MKFLKFFLFLLLLLVGLFFLLGLLKSSVSYGAEIKVNKPVEEAWAVSQDPTKYSQWLEGFKSMELISGEEYAVGSKYKVIVNPGEGQPDFEMIETLEAIKENEYVDLSFESDMMDFKQRVSFEGDGMSSTVRSDSEVVGKGLLMRSMFAVMEMFGGSFTKQESKNFEALKKLINNNTTDYNPAPEVLEAVDEASEVVQ